MIDEKTKFEEPLKIEKKVEVAPANKKKFVLKQSKQLPESPSYNDLVVWCLTRKEITIDQLAYAELPETLRALFAEK